MKRVEVIGTVPKKGTDYASGHDLYAAEDVLLKAGGRAVVPTGTKIFLPTDSGITAFVRGRSGLAFKEDVFAFDGTGDEDYTDEYKVLLLNRSANDVFIQKGTRVAQLVFLQTVPVELVPVEEFTEKKKAKHEGFGSTGKK